MQPETGRIQVYIVGQAPGSDDVRAALEAHDDVEVVGVLADAEDERLAEVDADAVLYAVADDLTPDRLERIRAATDAPVILLAATPPLLEQAIESDVDALLLPQPVESVLFALRRASGRRDRAVTRDVRGRVVTVFSPKGGTGKSATATNLALALTANHGRTLLLDLDLQFGDAAIMLGVDPERTIHDLVGAAGELDADKLAGYVTRHPSGLDLLAAPARPEEAEMVSAARVTRVLEVAREAYEFVVVDTAPLLHGPVLAALDETDALLLLAILDVPTLKDIRQVLETLELIPFPPERVLLVLNRCDAPVGITRDEVEAAWGRRFRFALPEDLAVPCAVNRGRAVVLSDPDARFSHAIRDLAADLSSAWRPGASRTGRVGSEAR